MRWKQITRLAAIAAVVSLLLPMAGGVGANPPWQSRLTSGYGSDSAAAGVRGAAFIGRTERPVLLPAVLRGMVGDNLTGDVQVSGWVSTSRGITATLSLDDYTGEPAAAVLTGTCHIEMPVGAAVSVSGTIRSTTWDAGAGWPTLWGVLRSVGGVPCP